MAEYFSQLMANNGWSRLSNAIKKPFVYTEPTEAYVTYIQGKHAYLTSVSLALFYLPQETHDLGPAIDVSVCLDMRWRAQGDTFSEYTFGEPYIATIDTANRLFIQQSSGGAKLLLDTNVTHCYLCRGWHHISDITQDQGIICFYIKNHKLFSRTYKYQESAGGYVWQNAETYNVPNVNDVQAYRLKDYRIAIVVKTSAGNKILLTERQWAGQAIGTEIVGAQINAESVFSITQLQKVKCNVTEIVQTTVAEQITNLYGVNNATIKVACNNPNGTQINLCTNIKILPEDLSTNAQAIKVKDSMNYTYTVTKITYAFPYYILEVMDFNNAVGDLTLSCDNNLHDIDGQVYPEFTVTFTPQNLKPLPADPPLVSEVINVDTEVV